MDTKFLNYSNAPIVSPLRKSLNIQLYNDRFSKLHLPSLLQPSRDLPSNPIDKKYIQSHTPLTNMFPTIKELFHAKKYLTCPMEEFPFSPDGLNHLQIQESKHKLLFIKFTLVSTLIPPCYLIQFYLYITLALNPATPPNVMYYYFFLAKHPNEIHKSDEYSQWWLEWHDYS